MRGRTTRCDRREARRFVWTVGAAVATWEGFSRRSLEMNGRCTEGGSPVNPAALSVADFADAAHRTLVLALMGKGASREVPRRGYVSADGDAAPRRRSRRRLRPAHLP